MTQEEIIREAALIIIGAIIRFFEKRRLKKQHTKQLENATQGTI